MRKPTDFRPVFVVLGMFCGGAEKPLQRLCKTGFAARRATLKSRTKTAAQSHFLHFAMLLKSALQYNKASHSGDGILPSLERLAFVLSVQICTLKNLLHM